VLLPLSQTGRGTVSVDESSVSSLESQSPVFDKEHHSKSAVTPKTTGPIIIGGLQYDGVGKDTTSKDTTSDIFKNTETKVFTFYSTFKVWMSSMYYLVFVVVIK